MGKWSLMTWNSLLAYSVKSKDPRHHPCGTVHDSLKLPDMPSRKLPAVNDSSGMILNQSSAITVIPKDVSIGV